MWLEDQINAGRLPEGSDQFNSLQDKLEAAFGQLNLPQPFYFSSVRESIEDRGTVAYLMDIAAQAGVDGRFIALEDIGELNGQFVDEQNEAIKGLFKLYPWEHMVREDFARLLTSSDTLLLEPAWKMPLSNKDILPLMWQGYPNHPNLLPAFLSWPMSMVCSWLAATP